MRTEGQRHTQRQQQKWPRHGAERNKKIKKKEKKRKKRKKRKKNSGTVVSVVLWLLFLVLRCVLACCAVSNAVCWTVPSGASECIVHVSWPQRSYCMRVVD
jgi:hypothetical protein